MISQEEVLEDDLNTKRGINQVPPLHFHILPDPPPPLFPLDLFLFIFNPRTGVFLVSFQPEPMYPVGDKSSANV